MIHKLFIVMLFLIANLYFYYLAKYGFGYTRKNINLKNWFGAQYKTWIIIMIILIIIFE